MVDSELTTYVRVMGITGSVPEIRCPGQWESNLQHLRVPEVRQEYIHRRVVVAAVKALTEFLNVRRALAPHSFPLDRHASEDPSGSVGL
eukprot:994918-Rhodomonas_salina.2